MKREYSKQAEKYIAGQNEKTRDTLFSDIAKLPSGDVKKLKGKKDSYRLRTGNIRILFKIMDNYIYIEKIDNRGQVYKD